MISVAQVRTWLLRHAGAPRKSGIGPGAR